jgi:NADH-quinone oxidoreductase subunit A
LIHPYAVVGLFLLVALVFGAAPVLLAWLVRPTKQSPGKVQENEGAGLAFDETSIELKSQVYLFGLTFAVFQVAVVFLFPWALAYDELPLYAVVVAPLFLALPGAGVIYAWRKGWLGWT